MGTSKRENEEQAGGNAEFILLQLAAPGQPLRNIAVLLLDPKRDRLFMRFPDDWSRFGNGDYAEILSLLAEDFEMKVGEMGAEGFLRSLEDTLSNFLRLSDRTTIRLPDDFKKALDDLFTTHVIHAM